MRYYTIQQNSILIAENEASLTEFYENVFELPDDYQEGKYIIDGVKLVFNEDWTTIELNNLKNKKILENDAKRELALNGGVEYKGVLFDSDTDQKINLLATISMLNDETTLLWFGMDNTPLECSKQDLINIGGEITALHTFCWTQNAEIKQEIENAKDIEDLNNIEINYGCQDELLGDTDIPED